MSAVDRLIDGMPELQRGLLMLSNLQGPEYLQKCAEWLQQALGVHTVSIGELDGPDVDRIRILGFASRTAGERPASYGLQGTPCLEVISRGQPHCLVNDASAAYPQDKGFRDKSIVSYAGLPLRDGFGRLFGLVCAFDDKPQSAPEDTLALLEWLTPRLGREAGVLRTQRNILNSVRWMATSSSEQVFTHAVAHLCEVLQVTTAFLIENSDEDPSSGVVRALLHRGNRLVDYEGTRVEYSGRPFAQLSSEDRVCIPEGLPERYPGWGMVHRLGVQSLIVYGMRHPNGQPIGSLGVGHTRTLEPGVIESPVFSLYIARVAAELARLRDERERLEMERVLSVKHKMESLGLMAGHIAHDFNNLLMAILGNANLASEVLDAASPARRFIDNIESASLAAGEIVGQLLDYAGRKPSKPMLVEVSELVSSASALVELSHYPSARVVYELQPDLPRVETDPSQLQQVIVNLVLNAAEALGGKPGRIRIRTDLVTLQARQIGRLIQGRDLHPGRYVCISVTDDGVGIEEAALNRIFDPFFTSKKEGRGLGLSAVRGYVESSGGGLAISSRVGAGTSVRLYLQPV